MDERKTHEKQIKTEKLNTHNYKAQASIQIRMTTVFHSVIIHLTIDSCFIHVYYIHMYVHSISIVHQRIHCVNISRYNIIM